ncbi:MAG: hypothetical protein SGILL_000517 [Bacillariaceae sp.]
MRFSLSDDVIDDEGDGVEEPTHPIGFQSPYGKTWISLDPPTPSAVKAAIGRTKYGLFDSDSEDGEDKKENRFLQSFPPLSSYVSSEVASTADLLWAERASWPKREAKQSVPGLQPQQEDDELYYSDDDDTAEQDDSVVDLLLMNQPTRSAPPEIPDAIKDALSSPPPSHRSEIRRNVQRKVEEERRRIDEECRRNAETLSQLVIKSEKEAAVILKKKQVHEEQLRKEQEARDEKQRQEQEARDAQAAKLHKEEQRKQAIEKQQEEEQQKGREQERQVVEQRQRVQAEKIRKKFEFVEKAKKIVGQLVQLRASVKPFEESKAVSKRRLGMKKIARGKLNTLSESAQKVQEVATEVSQFVSQVRQEDEMVKQGLERGDQGLTREMTRGKRYFFDLLASNAMTRVQAESFNGVKGDGFPLAAMLSMFSVENKDFSIILEAHVYTVCPTAIPTLPSPKEDANEDDLMTGLGMQRDKKGEFESFPAFLARTEKIISFMAGIQASVPSTHTLMGGNLGAVKWLERFLDLLPPAPTAPLPLVTAPVLEAFLNGAGHMLANKHADAFKKLLGTITDDIVNRVDDGEIGKPSSIRLKKVLEGGFEHFRTNLPSKAIAELYYGASGESKQHVETTAFGGTIGGEDDAPASQQQTGSGQSPFGQSHARNQGFGGARNQGSGRARGNDNRRPCRNFAKGSCTYGNDCKFSHDLGNGAPNASGGTGPPAQNAFGGTSIRSGFSDASTGSFGANTFGSSPSQFSSASNAASPFGNGGNAANPSPFASSNSGPSTSGFSSNQSNQQSPFGASSSGNAGFGSNNQPASPSPFGGGTNNTSSFGASSANANPTPFGGNNNAASPFGSGNPTQPFVSSNPSPSPFGGGNASANPSSFGAGGQNSNPSPFGGGNTNPNASPFAGGNASQSSFSNQNQSTFGGAKTSQPFGSSGSTNPSPFGGGTTNSTPSQFSSQANSTFGANSTSSFGSGANTNPSPFGGNNTQPFGSNSNANPSPFSSGASFGGSSGFGANSQKSQRFGNSGGNNKAPCTYFAQGNCRFGNDCRNSHDIPARNNGGFGGGRGNSSGFGGGGGFGQSAPFGGPRR